MLPERENPALAAAVAGKVRARLSEPDVIEGYEIRMTTSIDTALYPADGIS